MTRILVFFVSSLIVNGLFAQYTPVLKGEISFSRFSKSTTYILLTEDDEFNSAFKEAVEEEWTLTPIEFIEIQDFTKEIKNTELSFMVISDFRVLSEKKRVGALALYNGGFDNINLLLNSSLAYVVYDNYGLENEISKISYKIKAMVAQLEDAIKQVKEKDVISKNINGIQNQLNKYYNSKAGRLRTKTLLIDIQYMHKKINSVDDFTNKYKYDFEFVKSSEIEKAIASQSDDYAVLNSAYNLYKTNTVIDCSNYEIIYIELEVKDPLSSNYLDKFDYLDMELLNTAVKKGK